MSPGTWFDAFAAAGGEIQTAVGVGLGLVAGASFLRLVIAALRNATRVGGYE